MVDLEAREEVINKALHYFNVEHWNCAESVYLALFKNYYGVDVTPKTVTAYGGGIARTGNICGAINVAVMGISQKYGREDPDRHFFHTKRPVLEFLCRVTEELGSIHCIELSGCDLSELEGKRKFRDENILKEKCTPLIRKVMEIFFYIVEEWTDKLH